MSKVAIVYWSGTGNTEAMAKRIQEGVQAGGGVADLFLPGEFTAAMLKDYSAIAFGCPSMGAEQLEESEFEPMYAGLESALTGKKVALFGSFGWGDGEWMRTWQAQAEQAGAQLLAEGLIVCGAPEGDDETRCDDLGRVLARA